MYSIYIVQFMRCKININKTTTKYVLYEYVYNSIKWFITMLIFQC